MNCVDAKTIASCTLVNVCDLSNLPSTGVDTTSPHHSDIKRNKAGRPKLDKEFNRKEYNKEYYKNNRDKYIKEFYCPTCNVMCSYSNKSKHLKGNPHNNKLKEILENTNC